MINCLLHFWIVDQV